MKPTYSHNFESGVDAATSLHSVERAAANLIWSLKNEGLGRKTFLIGCSKTKLAYSAEARLLYTSPLFRKTVELADRLSIPFLISSAKYGVISPNIIIDPYDMFLKDFTKKELDSWYELTNHQLSKLVEPNSSVYIWAGEAYSSGLKKMTTSHSLNVNNPLRGLSLGNRLKFINGALRTLDRDFYTRNLYECLEKLSKNSGIFKLKDIRKKKMPQQGVYFFLDENEVTNYSRNLSRIVRIGTHGVSKGSRSSLKKRLTTHLGTTNGLGNHRGSVFRLHVGQAMISKLNVADEYPTWAKGQSASNEISKKEAELERAVTNYISEMYVVYIPLADISSKFSLRALIEKATIGLLTEDYITLDAPSPNWLGQFSKQENIKRSGLWNVRCVGDKFDTKVIEYVNNKSQIDLET